MWGLPDVPMLGLGVVLSSWALKANLTPSGVPPLPLFCPWQLVTPSFQPELVCAPLPPFMLPLDEHGHGSVKVIPLWLLLRVLSKMRVQPPFDMSHVSCWAPLFVVMIRYVPSFLSPGSGRN